MPYNFLATNNQLQGLVKQSGWSSEPVEIYRLSGSKFEEPASSDAAMFGI